jgi:hypothetical protein
MNQTAAHNREYTRNQADLYLAFELGDKELELTRFGGHLNLLGGGVHDGENKTTLCA